MQAKSTFLFVLISSMKLASGTPILDGLLKGVLGGGGLPIGGGALGGGGGIPIVGGGKGGNGGSNVNVDGLLHGLNDILAEPLCSVGLGCDNCDGLLEGLQPPLGKTINSLGLGVDCDDDNGKGNQKGKGKGHVGGGGRGGNQVNEDGLLHGLNGILAKPLCSVGLGCNDCKGLLEGLQPPLGKPLNSLGLGIDCDDSGHKGKTKPGKGNDSDGCGCDGNQVPIGGGKHGHRGGHGGHGGYHDDCDNFDCDVCS